MNDTSTKPRPYVGITGPVTVAEVKAILDEFLSAGITKNTKHIPMVGFLASYKTLNGQKVKNRRYPPIEDIPKLIDETAFRVLPMVHYNSRETGTLATQITKVFENIPEHYHNLQLNIPWPDIAQVGLIKDQFPDMQIVFQASGKAMKGKTPRQIAEGVVEYGDSISYILIDPSGGRGLPFDMESSSEIYSELRGQCPDLTIGFAGGFTGENVAVRLQQLITATKGSDFCIDAEGGLRDKVTEAYGDDLLNMEKARAYLQAASGALRNI
jgi:hypothetical protein